MRPRPPPWPRGRMSAQDPRLEKPPALRIWLWVAIALAIVATAVVLLLMTNSAEVGAAEEAEITVYKSPTCGCCTAWVEHLEANGFRVAVREQDDLGPIKTAQGIPPALRSCHTAVMGEYVIEGHVPADLIEAVRRQQPPIRGLAVPGMPIGSPGMEGPNPQRYAIVAFDDDGGTRIFATRQGQRQ